MTVTRVQTIITFHQPLTASEAEVEAACERGYAPLLDAIAAVPQAHVAVHFSGHLLDVLSRRQSEILTRVKALVMSGQAEVLGGLFYGAVPALMHELDVRGQVEMMNEYWESAVGKAPTNFWLPELAWSDELPRLLDETGLTCGFVSANQILWPGAERAPLVVVERGGRSVGAFVLDPELSASLTTESVTGWADRLATRGSALVSVWARAEELGLKPGTAERLFAGKWLAQWLQLLAGARPGIESVLPNAALATAKPAIPVRLSHVLPSELKARGVLAGDVAWTEFVARFPALDTVYRRSLRVSDKLREAIDTMEADGLEDAWSDALATAQRLVFGAQSPDIYWRGPMPGFADAALRDAVVDRLSEAEAMIDTLVQGEEDWISVEEADHDGDLTDEIFVANRLLGAWIAPAKGAWFRALDDRDAARNILDVDGACLCERLLPADAARAEAFGAGTTIVPELTSRTQTDKSEINEEGDGTYHLEVQTRMSLPGVKPVSAIVHKSVDIPIDRAEVTLRYELEAEGAALVAVQIPIRLSAEPSQVSVNGKPVPALDVEVAEARTVVIEAPQGTTLTIDCEPALDIWLMPPASGEPSHGLYVVALLRADRVKQATLKLALAGEADEAEAAEAAAA
jgi:hypothetical protein